MFNMFHVNVRLEKDSCLVGEHNVENMETRGEEDEDEEEEEEA